jgi:UDP-glucose 4-epimerase
MGGMAPRRAAITGAAGFLGQHLVRAFEHDGWSVLRIARSLRADSGIPAHEIPDAARETTMDMVLQAPGLLDGIDVLVHAAAIRHRHGTSLDAYMASNVDLSVELLRKAAGRIGRMVYISSVGVYGFPDALPVTESNPFRPRTLYSVTKVEAEKQLIAVSQTLKVDLTILRPTIIYGAGDRNGMMDKLAAMLRAGTYRIVGDGLNTLHHTHVDDVSHGVLVASRASTTNDHFIVAGPETVTLRELSGLVARACGRRVPAARVPLWVARLAATTFDVSAYRGWGYSLREPPLNHEKLDVMTRSISFSSAKAIRLLGYAPSVTYADGIARTLGTVSS